jgi:hypothetical protein
MSENKAAYVVRQKGNIASWNAEIDKFQAKADRTVGKKVEQYHKHIKELKEKHAGLEAQVSTIEKSLELGWEGLKTGADKAFKELDKSFKAAKTYFN